MKNLTKIVLLTVLIIIPGFVADEIYGSGLDQWFSRAAGGTSTIELPIGLKLEMITWKGDSLWYVTRPRRENEPIEMHTFKESSLSGIVQGTVIIKEH